MKGNTKHSRRILRWMLAGMCLVLAARLFWATGSTPGEPGFPGVVEGHSAVAVESPDIPVESDSLVVDASTFDEIVARPLFNESRRPYIAPKVEEIAPRLQLPPPLPAMQSEKFLLSGVVITPQRKIALLRVDTQNVVQRLTLGDTLVGWTVAEITTHSVTMRNGEQVQNIELEIKPALPAPHPVLPAPREGRTEIPNGLPQAEIRQAAGRNAPPPPPPNP